MLSSTALPVVLRALTEQNPNAMTATNDHSVRIACLDMCLAHPRIRVSRYHSNLSEYVHGRSIKEVANGRVCG